MKRYAIWNKKDNIILPTGEILTPEEWIARHPIAGNDNITILCDPSTVNGAYFGVLNFMVEQYARAGCDFSSCTTDEEKLAVIEAFDEATALAEAEAIAEAKAREDAHTDSLVSIAASLEYQNLLTLDDVEG